MTFYGLGAPKGTPAPKSCSGSISEINRALQTPEIRAKIDPTGAEIVGGTAQEFGDVLKENMSKMKKIISEAGIKP